MNAHEIIWKFDDGLSVDAVCNDPDCLFRYVCASDCEVVYDVKRTPEGVTHGVYDWEGNIKPHLRHDMVLTESCAFESNLTADPSIIPELRDTSEVDEIEIGRTAVDPVWQGEDGVLWKRALEATE